MTEWRPDDWENPYYDEDSSGLKRADIGYDEFEAGADAILKALTDKPLMRTTTGWLIFIPEVNNERP